MNLLDPGFYENTTLLILAVVALLTAIQKLVRTIKTSLPKNFLQAVITAARLTSDSFAREMSLPREYPLGKTIAEVLYSAIFYVLTAYCFFLLLIIATLVFFSSVVAWKLLAASALAFVITLMSRWCFKQAEVSRIKLSATSRVLW